jgi:hypothetical protein
MRVIAMLLVTFLLRPTLAVGEVAAEHRGRWSGNLVDSRSSATYPVEIDLAAEDGRVSYPSLGCGGTLRSVNGQAATTAYEFRERLTTSGRCVDFGNVTLTPAAPGRLRFHWFRGNKGTSDGTLVRSPEVKWGSAVLDVRRISEAGDRHYMIFHAKPTHLGSIGHAFVTWALESAQSRQTTLESFGFYPRRGIGLFGAVPGDVRAEDLSAPTQARKRLVVRVDSHQYKSARSQTLEVETIEPAGLKREDYTLLNQNCVDFVAGVARHIGLPSVPPSARLLPTTWLGELIDANPPR